MPMPTWAQSSRWRPAPGRRLARYAAAACAVLVLGTGCSEPLSPAPIDSAPTSASPTQSATPSPSTAPTLPPEARGTSKKSAVAFVRHWVEAFNHAVTGGSTKWLHSASTRCVACEAMLDVIEEVYDREGRIRTKGWRVESIEALSPKAPVQVRVVVEAAPQAFEVPGEKTQRFVGGPSVKTFTLARQADSWRVTYLDQS